MNPVKASQRPSAQKSSAQKPGAQRPGPGGLGAIIIGYLSGLGRFIRSLLQQLFTLIGSLVQRGYLWVESWLLDSKKSLYGLGVTRIVFGVTGLTLLMANFSTRLYSFGPGSAWNGEMPVAKSDLARIGIFSMFHDAMLNGAVYTLLYLILMLLAVLFILGWRFRIVLPLYFIMWVSFIEANDMLGDQGDNMYRIALLLFFFADPAARLSLDARRRAKFADLPASTPWLVRVWRGHSPLDPQIGSLFHNLALVALTAQVCFVYASGALYKAGGVPWSTGYAIYNPLMTERFGTWPELSQITTHWGAVVAAISWGSIIMQITFPLLLLTRPTRILALFGIMSFHIGIAVLMGLPWFSLTMIAIDFIFVRDRTWKAFGGVISSTFTKSFNPSAVAAEGAEGTS
ncbi:HTTM domain-containing protein [Psychromicrobium xiongbiense]|uniref:HTTM domain-containing protein n=1 Tax=Psychromicrobium xiongbiense TaxID=3051184 RepID=UPI002556EC1F|nr:HTTM domain-containing protein [Psychromicrobium sp. YIM S02556]